MSPTPAPVRPRPRRADDTDISRELLAELAGARTSGDARRVTRAEEQLCRYYLDYATSIANRFRGRGVDYDDVLQVARMGLVKAIRGWQPQPDGGFLQYATPMISGEVKRHFRDHRSMIRMPRSVQQVGPAIVMARADLATIGHEPTDAEIAERAGISEELVRADRAARERCAVGSLDAPEAGDDPAVRPAEETGCSVEDRVMLRQSIARLSKRERAMIGMRYFGDRTQDQIGKSMGISQMQVSRLLRDILAKMRDSMEAA
jgi:RNA polymerase sigma-B factor